MSYRLNELSIETKNLNLSMNQDYKKITCEEEVNELLEKIPNATVRRMCNHDGSEKWFEIGYKNLILRNNGEWLPSNNQTTNRKNFFNSHETDEPPIPVRYFNKNEDTHTAYEINFNPWNKSWIARFKEDVRILDFGGDPSEWSKFETKEKAIDWCVQHYAEL